MRNDQEVFDETTELARYLLGNVIGSGYEVPADYKFHEAADPRGKAAWDHAIRIMEMTTKTEMADVLTAVLDRPDRSYGVRLWGTFRVCCETHVEATSHAEAVKKAAALDHSNFAFSIDESACMDGDETAMVYGPCDEDPEDQDPWSGEGAEVDMRPAGEPFSWDAVKIVKELAALADVKNETFVRERILDIIARSKAACTATKE